MKKGQRKAKLKRPEPYWNKKRKRWVARVAIGDGKYRTTSHKTKPEAIAAIDRLWRRKSTGATLKSHSVKDVIELWLTAGESKWKVKTVEDYRFAIAKMEPIWDVPIDVLLPEHVDQTLATLPSPQLKNRVRKTLGTVIRWAIRRSYCSDNPVEKTDPAAKPKPEITVFEPDEIIKVVDNLPRMQNAILLMYYLALRPGELWALHWDDWNRKKQTLHIRRNVKEVRGSQFIETPKTTSSVRVLPLGSACIELLTGSLAEAMKSGRASKDDIIFPSANGGYIRASNFRRTWKKAIQDAEVDYRKIYTLRHTAATIWLNSGVSLAAVSRWLGHSNITTTLRHYSHLMLDDLSAVRDFWEGGSLDNLHHNLHQSETG